MAKITLRSRKGDDGIHILRAASVCASSRSEQTSGTDNDRTKHDDRTN
jgi:hypothetical protein